MSPWTWRLFHLVKHRSLWMRVRRNVTTWSSVGTAFNAKPAKRLDMFEKSVVCTRHFHCLSFIRNNISTFNVSFKIVICFYCFTVGVSISVYELLVFLKARDVNTS